MKLFAFVAALFLSVPALAFDAGQFEGGGVWKAVDGSKGKWTEVMTVSKDPAGVVLKSELTVTYADGTDEVMTTESTFARNGDAGFFTITTPDGVGDGEGYCFKKKKGKVCHMSGEGPDGRWEETMIVKKGVIKKIGSHKNIVAWKGKLKWAAAAAE